MPDAFAREFLRTLLALGDYLPSIVLIGGCVPYVYSKYMFEKPLKRAPVHTRDLDLLVENQIPLAGSSIVFLMQAAGYSGRTLESRHTQYFKFESRSGTGFEVEFLTPAPGGEHSETMIIQSGLRAQVVPGLELLLVNHNEVRILDKVDDITVDLTIRVPTPGAFVLNKLQTYLGSLGGEERKKDIYYVFYVVSSLPIGKQAIVDSMRECISRQTIEMYASKLQPLFSDEHAPGTRDVAAQLSGLSMAEPNKRLLVHLEVSELLELMRPREGR